MKKNKKGFTLIEIIVVLIIMGILLAIAIPAILGYVEDAEDARYLTVGRSINQEVLGYVEEKMVEGKNRPFGDVVREMKADLSVGTNNRLDEIIQVQPFEGEAIHSIDLNFDGLNSVGGWDFDSSLTAHEVTKISIIINTNPSSPTLQSGMFLVTSLNDGMYIYRSYDDAYEYLGTQRGPVIIQ